MRCKKFRDARGAIDRVANTFGGSRLLPAPSVSIAVPPPPPPAPIQRTLIETPPPSMLPEPPLPALKPGTELSLAESEALADQASPKAPLEPQFTASQRAIGRAAGQRPTRLPPVRRRRP